MRQISETDDKAIIELLFARSGKALDVLGAKYGKLARHIAATHHSDARDEEGCVNDAMMAVWNSIPPNRPDSLMAYFCGIVRNLSIKKYHRAENGKTEYIASFEELCSLERETAPTAEETALKNADNKVISSYANEFLSKLSKENRVLFIRRFWYCDSYADIAKMTGLSEGTLRTRINRLKAQMKAFLAEKGVTGWNRE